MKTLVEIVKTLFLILVMTQVLYLFMRRTFAGRSILMVVKIIREMFRLGYLTLEHTYKFMVSQSEKLKKENAEKPIPQKAETKEQPSSEKKPQKQPSRRKTATGEIVEFPPQEIINPS